MRTINPVKIYFSTWFDSVTVLGSRLKVHIKLFPFFHTTDCFQSPSWAVCVKMHQGLADCSACPEAFDLSPLLLYMVNSATRLEDQYTIMQIIPLDKIIES